MTFNRSATTSSFDKLRMRSNGRSVEILILSLSKDEDFGPARRGT